MIACVRIFYLLIRNTRVKNRFYALVDKVLNVTVYKFCRVASTFTRYRVDTFFIKVMCTSAGNSYGETKLSKECKPQRIIFIYIKHTRYTDNAVRCFICLYRLVCKCTFVFIIIKIRHLLFRLFKSRTTFTTVTGYKLTSVRKFCYCKLTVVVTLLTTCK